MLTRRLGCLAIGAILAVPAPAGAQGATGRVVGTVLDAYNAFSLPGVTVEVVGADITTVTELDGKYSIEVPAGPHEIRFSLPGYRAKTLAATVEPGRATTADATLPLEGYTEEVTVTAAAIEADTSTAAAQLTERRRSPVITDNVGATEMKSNADSDAAAAMQRITGLSVVGNSMVFVRGLGERYSNTTLNGAVLPSTDYERRVIPLDIFPTGLLDSVSVVKSYTPDRSAEFAGGLVEIVPSKLPSRASLDFSYSLGLNSQTFGEDIIDHPGGDADWLGLPDGRRSLPAAFPEGQRVIRGGIFTPELGFLREELERLGELLPNVWEPRAEEGRLNQGFSAAYGNRWGKVGLLASVTQSYRNHFQEEVQNYYRLEEGGLSTFSEYAYDEAVYRGNLAAVLGVGVQVTPLHRLSLQAFNTNKGSRETRTFEGFNADAGRNLRNARLLWREESLFNAQLIGDHLLSTSGAHRLDWRLSASRSDRDEPDLRETLYEEIGGAFQLADESQSGFRMFNDLDEDTVDIAVNWSTFFAGPRGLPTMVKAGPYFARRNRDFNSRRFRFIPLDIRGFDLARAPEALFTPANIGRFFELREETRGTDTYDAEQAIVAGYGMLDLPLSNSWRLVAGARVERFDQTVRTFDSLDLDVEGVPREIIAADIASTDVFPSVNLVYAVHPEQNIRFGYSQTVNRPEFRELSPFEFTDIVGGRAVVGNPALERSLIQNVDVRWEWFPGAEEVLAASVFYKNFDKPIERFVEPTAQLRTSYTNAESARNFGFELEARKAITTRFNVGLNYTFIDSEITLQPFQTNVLTNLTRPLSGTSDNIVNAMIEARTGTISARLLFNYFSGRIADVGSLGLDDIVETGRPTLDFIYAQRFGQFTVRVSAENLTDEAVTFEQGGLVQREFTLGRTFAVQFGVNVW